MLPEANVQNLMLRQDLVDACRAGRFAIHAIARIEEGAELLTGRRSGVTSVRGRFVAGGRHDAVARRLEELAERDRAAQGSLPDAALS